MTFITDPTFYGPFAMGLLGILLWLLASWANPKDDSLTGTLKVALWDHSRTTFVSVLSYFGLCLMLHQQDALNAPAAFFAGYTVQSGFEKAAKAFTAKQGDV